MLLKSAARWNQTEDDWRRLLELESEGCFGLDVDGRLAATATVVRYGRELAWIGMVLTLPEFRRRGLARACVVRALEFASDVRCVKLDATELGQPLYEECGFQVECFIERWVREAGDGGLGPVAPVRAGAELDLELDRRAFGADRERLLRSLMVVEAASLGADGYALGRPGSDAAYLGPLVARSETAAETLMQCFLQCHSRERIYWDVPADNTAAVRLAERCGFRPVRRLARMTKGGGVEWDPGKAFAIAGFEWG